MTERHLTVVGLTRDKQRLVLVSDTGEEYTVAVDTRLRSVLRGEGTGTGRLETTMESTLRPREIQARIRAGDTPESVAAAAETTLERVMAYATPVLAERAHVAQRALLAAVRRKTSDGPPRPLGETVEEQLRARNVDPDSVEWDAWRREDGRWTLVADFRAESGQPGRRQAQFVFDAPGRYVVPQDAAARELVGEPDHEPRPATRPAARNATDLDEELPLGEDAIGLVADAEGQDAEETTVDLSDTARAVREQTRPGVHPVPADPGDVTGDADWMSTQATARPARPQPVPDPDPVAPPAPAVEEQPPADDASAEPEDEPRTAEQPPRRTVKKTRGRASVPSWDEIMFGGGRSE